MLKSLSSDYREHSHGLKCLKTLLSRDLSPVERNETPPLVTMFYVIMVSLGIPQQCHRFVWDCDYSWEVSMLYLLHRRSKMILCLPCPMKQSTLCDRRCPSVHTSSGEFKLNTRTCCIHKRLGRTCLGQYLAHCDWQDLALIYTPQDHKDLGVQVW